MKKKLLNGINMVLGAMSVGLLGCKTTSHQCLYGPPPEPEKYGPPPEEIIMAKYGPPSMWEEPEPQPQPVKYGVPDYNPAGEYRQPVVTIEEKEETKE